MKDTIQWNNVVKNIQYIAKSKGIKIGKLEDTVGVSKGYFSRVSKHPNYIGIRILYPVSVELGTTINDLIEREYYKEIREQEIQAEIKALQNELAEIREEQ